MIEKARVKSWIFDSSDIVFLKNHIYIFCQALQNLVVYSPSTPARSLILATDLCKNTVVLLFLVRYLRLGTRLLTCPLTNAPYNKILT
jgi:hypothetical protein